MSLEDFQRNILEIPEGISERSFIISRRQIKDEIKYYLYTRDEESLVLSCIIDNKSGKYIVSTSALKFIENSEHYIGVIEKTASQYAFEIYSRDNIRNRLLMIGDCHLPHVFLNPDGQNNDDSHLIPQMNKNCSSNLLDFAILHKDKIVLSLKQKYQDEFILTRYQTLSIFQAFAVAVCACLFGE